MDYFDYVKHDPVNYYILYSIEDLRKIKENISKEELERLILDFKQYEIPYKDEKRSVIYKKYPLKGVDLKDYISLGTYYWKDETKKDGLPYILKDGLANPEGDYYDKQNLRRLAFMTYYQCILYYLSEDKKYLNLIIDNLNYYFLDEKTGMNPNMNHAQMVKGVNDGRGIGMIDFTANMSYALYMIKLLYEENMLEEEFYNSLKKWLNDFYSWYIYSPIALEEKYANNNHGIFYDFGLIVILDVLDKKEEIRPLVSQMIELRLIFQIKDDKMPFELHRTKSKNYSLMGIKGIYDFSTIASKYGFNLYDLKWYHRKLNIDLKAIEEYLYQRLVLKAKPWRYKQIIDFDEATLLPLVYERNRVEGKNDFKDIKLIKDKNIEVDLQKRLLLNLTN